METYYGHVHTPTDAIILFEACRIGVLPRVQRRLSEKERASIRSGSVFVWDEREAGMRRWTDGKSWSASRVAGSFLTYREMEGKRLPSANGNGKGSSGEDSGGEGDPNDDGNPGTFRYKPDGLMKQSFSITTSMGQKLHLISYYARSHPSSSTLQQPSNDPALKGVRIPVGMYPDASLGETIALNAPSPPPGIGQGPVGLPSLDIPVEKMRWTEDGRVLDVLRASLKL
ncbi:hypothetical protein SAICODRAFT_95426 [Saitoella complicata NRRL Y-17804]|uniref:uncharacterized protein n=1 Tax=Saitoella complicata (strain BCRC 22490 / CBS 7301 / JCM 7358 / NBRC 10748 / NRRL Y-17804) TaxID=698492 RepID=UPI000867BE93|nr:uncharacterized protein SAICODRAFT_95426 [Saitoella complicata NRRL Y-17804]ODQ51349.1 hypothetical protein SAICODRAFT_95426 [Saitoella complicata NRRL Y-17804]